MKFICNILNRYFDWYDVLPEPWRFFMAMVMIHPFFLLSVHVLMMYALIGSLVSILLLAYRQFIWFNIQKPDDRQEQEKE